MKKTTLIISVVFLVLIVLLPFNILMFACLGYTFELANYPIYAIITTLLSIFVAYLVTTNSNINKGLSLFLAIVSPLSLITSAFYIFECHNILVAASMFICVCCCHYLTIAHGKPTALKISTLVLSALMVLPIGFFSFIALTFGNIGQNTVVESIKSPNGTYYAEVIDSNQGALGGDTLVNVYKSTDFNAIIFKVSKRPQRVYHGEWGAFENMEIHWKDETCLVINSVEFEIE